MNMRKSIAGLFFMGCLLGCAGKVDSRLVPVEGFDLSRYLGTWYEIARLDHSFERGLVRVTAEYSLRGDGKVRVVNRGFNPVKNEWKHAEGKAKFSRGEQTGWLKVSFFGPFYADYLVLALDRDEYRYALVSGPGTSYLWILSREPCLDAGILEALKRRALELGFDTSALIMVEQDVEPQFRGIEEGEGDWGEDAEDRIANFGSNR